MFVNPDKRINFRFLEDPTPPTISITPSALAKSLAYVDLCDKEVGWLAHITKECNNYIIDECFLPKQEVTGASCEFTEDGLADIMFNLISVEGADYYDEVRCWCHSHVNMPTSPSGQDMKQILQWKDSEYQIMIIFNKQGEAHAEFYNFKDKIVFNNLPVELYNPDKKRCYNDAKQELERMVTYINPPTTSFYELEGERLFKRVPKQVKVKTSESGKGNNKVKKELIKTAQEIREYLLMNFEDWKEETSRVSAVSEILYGLMDGFELDFFKTHALNETALQLFKEILKVKSLKRRVLSSALDKGFDAEQFVEENKSILPDLKEYDLICPIATLEFLPMFAGLTKIELEEILALIEDVSDNI